MQANEKIYLGDGAYIQYDDYGFILTAENGIEATDTIYLEPEVVRDLFRVICATKNFKQYLVQK